MGFLRNVFSRLERKSPGRGADLRPEPRLLDARQFVITAEEQRREGRLDAAIETLERGTRENPTYVAAFVSLGRAYQAAERIDDAIQCLETVYGMDRENLVVLRSLGDLYLKKGDKVEAIKRLKRFRGLQPGDRDVDDVIRVLDLELNPPRSRPPAVEAPMPAERSSTEPELPESALPDVDAAAPRSARPEAQIAADGPTMALSILEILGPAEAIPGQVIPPSVGAQETLHESPPVPAAPFSDERLREPPVDEAPSTPPPSFPRVSAPDSATLPSGRLGGQGVISETLADLYQSQGHLSEARKILEALTSGEEDPERRQRLREKLAGLQEPRGDLRSRLQAWIARLPPASETRIEDIGQVLRGLLRRAAGVKAIALTDLEGLPVVSEGRTAGSAEMEALIAELTAFWKGVHRVERETAVGGLESLVVQGDAGTAVIAAISPEYALILHVAPGSSIGRIRYEASRAARLLKPALA